MALYERFRLVEGVQVLAVATLCDPRFKKVGFRDSTTWAMSKLKSLLRSDTGSTESQAVQDFPAHVGSKRQSSLWEFLDREVGEKNKGASSRKEDPIGTQLVKYLNASNLARNEDPLKWWEETGKTEYPDMYKLIERVLSVPGTSVPSERVFSTAGNIISQKRCNLTDESAANLIFLRENMGRK